MSIFSKIKDAIFGHPAAARPNTPASPPPASRTPAASSGPTVTPTKPAQAPAQTPVDVEAVLQKMTADKGQQLNWRTSIVDLMKLVGMDSSLTARKQLAAELQYSGDPNDSASMNVWLHKEVLKKLSENGGKVPQELLR